MIKRVTREETNKIIDTRKPLGEFLEIGDNTFIAIDNSTGDAWVEEFEDIEECIAWLNGEEYYKRYYCEENKYMKEYYGTVSFTGEIYFSTKAGNEEEAKEKVFNALYVQAESENGDVEVTDYQFGLIDECRQGNVQESFLWDFSIYEEE